jgi:DNA-binding MarR family transcriptional regulator
MDVLMKELFRELRLEQEAVQAFDEAAAAALGVNLTDLRCIGILERCGPLPASELARASGLTTGSVTALIDRLERAGYVRRERDREDRRRVFVALTERATAAIAKIWGPLGQEGLEVAGGYAPEELRFIIGYLRTTRSVLNKHLARIRSGTARQGLPER